MHQKAGVLFYLIYDVSFEHSKRHRAKIGDQPDQPYKNTELVKVDDHLLILLHKDDDGPDCMDQHQDDSKQARNTVDVEGHAAHKFKHHACAPSITNEAEHKENGMPNFEPALKSFTPDSNGVKK